MDKVMYIKKSFEIIRAKNLPEPFDIADGNTVTNLEKYLFSLESAYLAAKDPRLETLFFDKIEHLKKLSV